ncbi:DUF6011 domain-containing protein [uncultured Nocardioides sp.]|uniref:DUF6011 domain-containing protein n=1 Tax=uncultured Nocardioides sp. TaxID=198441 RepID=UPI0034537518
MAENREGPATRAKVTGPEISSANQIEIHGRTSDRAVRCVRCGRPLSSPRSVPRRVGRQCRLLLEQGVA